MNAEPQLPYRSDVEKICNPNNSTDWERSLNVPRSPHCETLLALLKSEEELNEYFVCQKQIESYISQTEKERKEARESYRDCIAAEKLDQTRYIPSKELPTADFDLENKTLEQLQLIVATTSDRILTLNNERKTIQNNMAAIEKNYDIIGKEIHHVQQTVLDDIKQQIIAENIKVVSPVSGRVTPEALAQALAQAIPPAPPILALKALHDYRPEFTKTATSVARERFNIQQFKAICNLCRDEKGEASAFNILECIRLNPDFGRVTAEQCKKYETLLANAIEKIENQFAKHDAEKQKEADIIHQIKDLEKFKEKACHCIASHSNKLAGG